MKNPQQVTARSGKDEWYTPPEILDAARSFLRTSTEFEVDLASCEKANKLVKAKAYYSIGIPFTFDPHPYNIPTAFWCNPPFSKVLEFTQILERYSKLKDEGGYSYTLGEGFVLVNANTETKFFQTLLRTFNYVLFFNKRISFLDANLNPVKGNTKGQALFYMPGEVSVSLREFRDHFGSFGACLRC